MMHRKITCSPFIQNGLKHGYGTLDDPASGAYRLAPCSTPPGIRKIRPR